MIPGLYWSGSVFLACFRERKVDRTRQTTREGGGGNERVVKVLEKIVFVGDCVLVNDGEWLVIVNGEYAGARDGT